jgi:serine protease Do
MPAGFLVLAASFSFLAPATPAVAQFPIRQIPRQTAGPPVRPADAGARSQEQGARGQESGIRSQGAGTSQPFSTLAAGPWPPAADRSPPLPAVARIVVPEKDGISYGSGTLIDARGQFGLVVSNWHVVRDAAGQITVEFPDGFKSPAQVVKTDKDWDLAALSIYRPHAAPVPVTASAPQPGDPLTIAGYGGGDWRIASGTCTQYLAPGVEFPHEMVELSAQARQGDSGGPILNQRGELAGVLFGSGPGYTSGSYGGRVLKFLATVVPGGTPGSDGLPPNSLPSDRALAAADPSRPVAPPIMPPPQATALHENKPAFPTTPTAPTVDHSTAPQPEAAAMTPALRPTSDPLLAPPLRREVADRFGSRSFGESADELDPRVAVVPSRLDLSPPPLATPNVQPAGHIPAIHAPLAPRVSVPAAGGDLHQAPSGQLLAAVWRQFGGNTLFDQTKSVLAIVGALALVIVFVRFGSQKEFQHHEE